MHPPLGRFHLDPTFYGRITGGLRGTLLVNSLYIPTRGVQKFADQPRRKTNFTTKRGVRDVTLLKRPLTQPLANRSCCFAQAVGCRDAGTRGGGGSGATCRHNFEAVGSPPPNLGCQCRSFLFLFVFAHEFGSLPKNSGTNR